VQAARRLAEEDDGAGWINPTNIHKYRAGAHMALPSPTQSPANATPPDGAGPRAGPAGSGAAQSYSTMMMGAHAVTRAVPLDGFVQVCLLLIAQPRSLPTARPSH
jgi:hypothetical protein